VGAGVASAVVVGSLFSRRHLGTGNAHVGDEGHRTLIHPRAKKERKKIMWSWADRMVKAVSDVTVGTVIVLVHIALADRNRRLTQPALPPHRRELN
jgi:hypothetical protein